MGRWEPNEQPARQRLAVMICPTARAAPLLTSASEPKSLNYTAECTHLTSRSHKPPPAPYPAPHTRSPQPHTERCQPQPKSRAGADGCEGLGGFARVCRGRRGQGGEEKHPYGKIWHGGDTGRKGKEPAPREEWAQQAPASLIFLSISQSLNKG